MKNLKKILLTSVMATTVIGSGATALAKEVASPGGYDFSHRLTPATAGLYLPNYGVQVYNQLLEANNLVSYWHSWFYDNDLSNRTDTTYIAKQNTQYVSYSINSNSGYVAVIEIKTTNYFYYLEVNHMTDTVAITYSHVGDYPLFYDAIWTAEKPIKQYTISSSTSDQLFIKQNGDLTKLGIYWVSDTDHTHSWILPY